MAPEPTEPFAAFSQAFYAALSAEDSEYPEDLAGVVFHLTLAGKYPADLDRLEAEFAQTYGVRLPVLAMAKEVSLYEKRQDRPLPSTYVLFRQAQNEDSNLKVSIRSSSFLRNDPHFQHFIIPPMDGRKNGWSHSSDSQIAAVRKPT